MAAILFLPFENGTKNLASLDRFGMNKILFMALINKTVCASNRTQMSGFQMVHGWDRHKIESKYRRRFGIWMLIVRDSKVSKNDHMNTGRSGYNKKFLN
jgi:hypothetical protein